MKNLKEHYETNQTLIPVYPMGITDPAYPIAWLFQGMADILAKTGGFAEAK